MSKRYNKKKRAKRRKWRRRIVFAVEVVVLLVLIGVLYVGAKLDKLEQVDIPDEDLEFNDLESQEIGGYTNIALFGVDSRDGSLESGARTDCIIIASINNKSKEVKLVSVYRDTYLMQDNEKFDKANAAFARGGAKSAINMLNKNLDLDIRGYVTVDFTAMTNTVDLLGGIEIEITDDERVHINNYAKETSKVTGVSTTEIAQPGLVRLDGVQATSYTRIRYTEGDDYKRTERQREVIAKILEAAKKTDIGTLNKIVDQVLPNVSTSLSSVEILKMAADIMSYELGETSGFPFDLTTKNVKGSGDSVIPKGLTQNVTQLHGFLFEDHTYPPTSTVENISNLIETKTGIGADNDSSG